MREENGKVTYQTIDTEGVDMTPARKAYSAIAKTTVRGEAFGSADPDRFALCPVAFKFPGPESAPWNKGTPVYIVATHAPASGKTLANAIEACFLQHFVTEYTTKKKQFVILLGDFNCDETKVQGMWDHTPLPGIPAHIPVWKEEHAKKDGPKHRKPNDSDEVTDCHDALDAYQRIADIRDTFFETYVRVFKPDRPTNVCPFMASKDEKKRKETQPETQRRHLASTSTHRVQPCSVRALFGGASQTT